jgi:hypothetical protein
MYGLLKGSCASLTPGQRREWRAHQCGVCTSLGRGFGPLSRLATHYDAALLSVLHEAQLPSTESPTRVRTRCPLPPFRGMAVPDPSGWGCRFGRDVAMLSAWAKLEDDLADGDALWVRLPGVPELVRRRAGSARRELEALGLSSQPIVDAVLGHSHLECCSASAEELYAPVESAYAALFEHTAHLAGMPRNRGALRDLGAALGRLTYLCDAARDAPDDQARGRRNLLVDCFGRRGAAGAFPKLARETWERLCQALGRLGTSRHRELLWRLTGDGLSGKIKGGRRASMTTPSPGNGEKARPAKKRRELWRGSGDWDGCWSYLCLEGCCDCSCCCAEACSGACTGAECCCCCPV